MPMHPPASLPPGMQRIWERGALKARSARARDPLQCPNLKNCTAVPSHLGECGVQERIRDPPVILPSARATQLLFLARARERATMG